jgi:hypothetical protein
MESMSDVHGPDAPARLAALTGVPVDAGARLMRAAHRLLTRFALDTGAGGGRECTAMHVLDGLPALDMTGARRNQRRIPRGETRSCRS